MWGFCPRSNTKEDHYQNQVHEVSNKLKHQLSNSAVKLNTHKNLNQSHLHDDRHLRRNKKQRESTEVQLLAKNVFEALTKKSLHPSRFDKILRYTPNTQFSPYKPTTYQNKMNRVCFRWPTQLSVTVPNSTQAIIQQHTEILIIITQIMKTVMNKIPFTDI